MALHGDILKCPGLRYKGSVPNRASSRPKLPLRNIHPRTLFFVLDLEALGVRNDFPQDALRLRVMAEFFQKLGVTDFGFESDIAVHDTLVLRERRFAIA